MKKKAAVGILFIGVIAAVLFWFLSGPQKLSEDQTASMKKGDAVAGERIFWAGGCGSCHAKKLAKGDEKLQLAGGHKLHTPVGTFVSPNITPDKETGIGNWSDADFANAMLKGVSPSGSHYFPSFPYTSYTRMTLSDVADLWAYMRTLPAIKRENEPHELSIFFKVRRGIGLWKMLFFNDQPIIAKHDDKQIALGQYLVEGLGHCGECHTPRTLFGLGGSNKSAWLAGAPSPEGEGNVPNITPHKDGLAGWSASDISEYLASGFTPDFDSVGGTMVSVQENVAKLPKADRDAIAAYLKSIPSVSNR